MFAKLTEFLDGVVAGGEIPGNDCIVYHRGREVYRHRCGFSDGASSVPMNGKELYNIYSISKLATCTAAMQLWEKGLFKQTDRLSDYIPEFADVTVRDGDTIRPAKNPILIENLFTMTSGLNYDMTIPELALVAKEHPACPTVTVAKYLARAPLAFDPGTSWTYGLSHDVLAALVEVVSGQKFADYTREHIFEPLGMKRTTFMLPDSELSSLSSQFGIDPDTKKPKEMGPRILRYKLGPEYASGGAGCISTVEDQILLLEALRKGDSILKKETVDFMTIDRLTPPMRKVYWIDKAYGYGLGVRCPTAAYDSGATDFGWGGAAGAFAAVDREREFTLFYSQHVLFSGTDRFCILALAKKALAG